MYFSVIVPIYGVEKYIRECVGQHTLSEFLTTSSSFSSTTVSPDGCPKICDEYGRRDKRVRVIRPSKTAVLFRQGRRDKGGNGRYVINVDGDDFIEPGYFIRRPRLCEKARPST